MKAQARSIKNVFHMFEILRMLLHPPNPPPTLEPPPTLVLFEVVQLTTWLISAPSVFISTPNELIKSLTPSMFSYQSRLDYKWLAQT